MMTGSLCLTEILKSWKPCSSKSEASQTADSTRASGVAFPYFFRMPGSREPALTPIRLEVPWALAAAAISLTWSSNLRMLPGFTRTAAHPASIAAKTYLGWKWMSAMTGICECWAISGSASASSWLGQATRTMSQPNAVSSAICWSVLLTSAVRVVVIDWTEIGDSLPTPTLPTLIWRVGRGGASTGGGAEGMPRLISVMASGYWWPRRARPSTAPAGSRVDVEGYDEVAHDQHDAHHQQARGDAVRDRQQLGDVDVPGVRATTQQGEPAPDRLPQRTGDVPAVEGQQRDEVEHPDEEVEPRDQHEQEHGLVDEREALLGHGLAGEPATADDADRAVDR